MKKINPKWVDLYRAEQKLLEAVGETQRCLRRLHLKRVPGPRRSRHIFMDELQLQFHGLCDYAASFDLELEITIADLIGGDVSDVKKLLEDDKQHEAR